MCGHDERASALMEEFLRCKRAYFVGDDGSTSKIFGNKVTLSRCFEGRKLLWIFVIGLIRRVIN